MKHDARLLLCRDYGHGWEPIGGISIVDRRPLILTRTLRCAQCGTERTDRLRESADELVPAGRRYKYPAGYQVKGGMTRGQARKILLYPRRRK